MSIRFEHGEGLCLQLEEANGADAAVMAEYEEAVRRTLATLTQLSSATEYHDRELLRGIVGIDLAAIAPPNHASNDTA